MISKPKGAQGNIKTLRPRSNLLVCLRAAGLRLRPAQSRERTAKPWRWRLLTPFRSFKPLVELPLNRLPGKCFYVHGALVPNGKATAAVDELKDVGIDKQLLVHSRARDKSASVKAIRLIVRLPWALSFLAATFKRTRKLDGADRQTLLLYALARRWLRNRPMLMPIIISDVSPSLHALWCAAGEEGNRAIWWQDDFHFHQRLPYSIRAAAVLNGPALEVATAAHGVRVIAKRPTSAPAPIRGIPLEPIVGMATNAFFSGALHEIESLNRLAKALKVEVIHLRLHPNSHLAAADLEGASVQLAPRDESMAEFAARIDLALVGNSAAQLWLIRNGVPVIHVAGFDQQGYDRHGYVERGFFYGSEYIDQIRISEIADFYEDVDAILAKVTEYTTVRVTSDVDGLEGFKKICSGK